MVHGHTLHLKSVRGAKVSAPGNEPWKVALDEPAISVMTDFKEHSAFLADKDWQIDDVLERMKHAGLRSAFVVDGKTSALMGLVTAYDIMGEKPLRYQQAASPAGQIISRDDIRAVDIMDPVDDWQVVELHDVEKATVNDVLKVFQQTGRTHIVVVDKADPKNLHVRGVFSSAKTLRLTSESRKAVG